MMKVSPQLRNQFLPQEALNLELKNRVDDIITSLKPPHWHYQSRVKGLESYALKVESGRVADPRALEDFFGCTVVVRNATEIPAAVELASSHFDVAYQRPKEETRTHKTPDSFQFDDLRLYLRLKRSPSLPSTDIQGIIFEMQVKTFLQHAWGIATHDLVYKNHEVKWGKARIAFQIKAMLEHAELAIEEAEKLSQARLVAKSTRDVDELADIIELVIGRWPAARLPGDLKRLAENIQKVLRLVRLRVSRVAELLDLETADGRGTALISASPYTAIILAIANREREALEKFLAKPGREKLAVPRDLDLAEGMAWPPDSAALVLL